MKLKVQEIINAKTFLKRRCWQMRATAFKELLSTCIRRSSYDRWQLWSQLVGDLCRFRRQRRWIWLFSSISGALFAMRKCFWRFWWFRRGRSLWLRTFWLWWFWRSWRVLRRLWFNCFSFHSRIQDARVYWLLWCHGRVWNKVRSTFIIFRYGYFLKKKNIGWDWYLGGT